MRKPARYTHLRRCLYALAMIIASVLQGLSAQQLSPEAALKNAFERGNLMVAISTVSWRPGLAMAAAQLQTGKTVSLRLSLQAGQNYAFIATADAESTDVDLFLRDEAGELVISDTEPDGTPILEFNLRESGEYQLQIHVPESDRGLNFVAVSLLQSGGGQIIQEEFRQLTARFFSTTSDIFSAYPNVRWRNAPNQWCLFGFSLPPKRGYTLRQLKLGKGRRYFAAAGSDVFQNIDLYLANAKNRIVALDKAPDAFPLLEYDVWDDQSHDLRLEVERSTAPGLILLGVFQQ